jgi:hypothetical protein
VRENHMARPRGVCQHGRASACDLSLPLCSSTCSVSHVSEPDRVQRPQFRVCGSWYLASARQAEEEKRRAEATRQAEEERQQVEAV